MAKTLCKSDSFHENMSLEGRIHHSHFGAILDRFQAENGLQNRLKNALKIDVVFCTDFGFVLGSFWGRFWGHNGLQNDVKFVQSLWLLFVTFLVSFSASLEETLTVMSDGRCDENIGNTV